MNKPNKKDAKRASVTLANVEVAFDAISKRADGNRSLKVKVRKVLHRGPNLKKKDVDKFVGAPAYFSASDKAHQRIHFPKAKDIREGKVIKAYLTSWYNKKTKRYHIGASMVTSTSTTSIGC